MLTISKYIGIALGIAILLLAYAEKLEPTAYLLIALAYLAGASWSVITHYIARNVD